MILFKTFFRYKSLKIIFLLLLAFLVSCKSSQKVYGGMAIPKKTKDVTIYELKRVAYDFFGAVHGYFHEKKCRVPGYLAFLKTKNNSTKILPVEVLEDEMISYLIQKEIYTVRREDRKEALKELYLSLSGLGEGNSELNPGQVKIPDYFVKITISENQVLEKNIEILQRIYSMDLRSVATQLTVLNKTITVTAEKRRITRKFDHF